MTTSDQFTNYITLLKTRQVGRRRSVNIIGGLFLVSFAGTIVIGLLCGLSSRAVYLVAGLITALGVGYLVTWVKLELVTETIELLENLQRILEENKHSVDQ